jgi:ribonuclease E
VVDSAPTPVAEQASPDVAVEAPTADLAVVDAIAAPAEDLPLVSAEPVIRAANDPRERRRQARQTAQHAAALPTDHSTPVVMSTETSEQPAQAHDVVAVEPAADAAQTVAPVEAVVHQADLVNADTDAAAITDAAAVTAEHINSPVEHTANTTAFEPPVVATVEDNLTAESVQPTQTASAASIGSTAFEPDAFMPFDGVTAEELNAPEDEHEEGDVNGNLDNNPDTRRPRRQRTGGRPPKKRNPS